MTTSTSKPQLTAIALRINAYAVDDYQEDQIVPNGGLTVALKYENTELGRKKAVASLLHSLWLSDLDLDKYKDLEEALDFADIAPFNTNKELSSEDYQKTELEFTCLNTSNSGITKQVLTVVGRELFHQDTYSLFPAEAELFSVELFDTVFNAGRSMLPGPLAPNLILDATDEKYNVLLNTHLSEELLSSLKIKNYVENVVNSELLFADPKNCILSGNSSF